MEYEWVQRHDPPPSISIDAPIENQPSGKFCEGSPPLTDHSLFRIEGYSEAGFIGLVKRLRLKPLICVLYVAVALLCEAKVEDADARSLATELAEIREKAEAGDAAAQNRLGVLLFEGTRVPADIEAALGYFRRAAQSGNSDAMFNLGEMYTHVSVVSGPHRALIPSDNMRAAREWWEKAATLEHPHAKERLGFYHELGLGGLERNPVEAARLYEESASGGSAEAASTLGRLFDFGGNGFPCDPTRSIGYYILAFDGKLGEDAHARISPEFRFGIAKRAAIDRLDDVTLLFGRGFDRRTVATFTRALAERGFVEYQYKLGVLLQSGDGLPRDASEAAFWYRKAAEKGNLSAQYNLGGMYSAGYGVGQDLAEAHAWWNIAGAFGDEEAKKALRLIETQMTREQIAEATKLAKERFEKFAPKN